MKTRYAETKDIPFILALAHSGVSEIIHIDRIDESVFIPFVKFAIFDPDHFFRVVVNDRDEPVAAIVFRVCQTFVNTDWICQGVGLFVSPKHRGKGLSRQLYQEALDWGNGFDKVSQFQLQTSAGLGLNFTNLFKKFGFDQIGWVYLKRK